MAAPSPRAFQCGKCGADLPAEVFNTPEPAACPHCTNVVFGRAFPALLQAPRGSGAGEALRLDDRSSCFFHPDRRAVVPCERCGRFLCSLCDLEIDGRHLCPGCLESGRKDATLAVFHTQHTRWDNVALMLAVVPLITGIGWYFSLFTAPAAIFIAIWKWKSPTQAIVPYNRGRFIVALLVAGLTTAAWLTLLYFALQNRFR